MPLGKKISRIWAEEEASVVTEYALLVGGIAAVIMATIYLLGFTVYDLFYTKALELFR